MTKVIGCAYRPFFIGASLWTVIHFFIWLPAYYGINDITGFYTPIYWHAHEMLFGFAGAVLAGFLLTVVPNWTGTLPYRPVQIYFLLAIWCAGRTVMVFNIALPPCSAIIDELFFPALLAVIAAPIVITRKWADLKVLAGVVVLTVSNILFHATVLNGGDIISVCKASSAVYVLLVTIIGGRMIPAYMKQALQLSGRSSQIVQHNLSDTFAIAVSIFALMVWVVDQNGIFIGISCALAGALNILRLLKWRVYCYPYSMLLLMLVLGYSIIPLAFSVISLTTLTEQLDLTPIHLLTLGVMSFTMLSVTLRLHARYQSPINNKQVAIVCVLLALTLVSRVLADISYPLRWLLIISGTFSFSLAILLVSYLLASSERKTI